MFKAQNVRCVLFDLDGVLINSNLYHLLAFEHALDVMDLQVPHAQVEHLFGETTREILQHLLKAKHISKQQLGKMVQTKHAFFRKEIRGKNLVFRAAPHVLEELKSRGYGLGLITGSGRNVLNATFPKKLQKFFDVIVTAEMYRHGKPNPEPLNVALRKLNVRPKDCVYVGDTLIDIQAAKAAGIPVISVPSGVYAAQELQAKRPDAVVGNLRQLVPLLLAKKAK